MRTRASVTVIAVVLLCGLAQGVMRAQTPAAKLVDAPMTHVGIVVADIDQAIARYAAALELPAPRVSTVTFTDEGASAATRTRTMRTATFPTQPVALRLVEPDQHPSLWREHLRRHGPSLHHIGLAVDRVEPHVQRLRTLGGVPHRSAASTLIDMPALGLAVELHAQMPSPVSPPSQKGFGAGPVVHVSTMVPDVEAAGRVAAEMLGVDLPPTVVVKMGGLVYPPDYAGDRKAAPKHVTFKLPNVLFELTAPQGGASPWRDQLDRHGASLHHVAFLVPNMADAIAHLGRHGGRLVLGGAGVSYAYVDLRPALDLTFELNVPPPPPAR